LWKEEEELEDTKGVIRISKSKTKRKTIYDKWNISVVICDTDIP
jgi:hypothetical protein